MLRGLMRSSCCSVPAQAEAAANPGHPLRQQSLQAYRPGIIGRFPDRLQNRQRGRAVGSAAWPPSGRRFRRRQRTVQHPDGMLAVIAAVGAELVQDALLLRPTRLPVARINALQIVSSRSSTHSVTVSMTGNILKLRDD